MKSKRRLGSDGDLTAHRQCLSFYCHFARRPSIERKWHFLRRKAHKVRNLTQVQSQALAEGDQAPIGLVAQQRQHELDDGPQGQQCSGNLKAMAIRIMSRPPSQMLRLPGVVAGVSVIVHS